MRKKKKDDGMLLLLGGAGLLAYFLLKPKTTTAVSTPVAAVPVSQPQLPPANLNTAPVSSVANTVAAIFAPVSPAPAPALLTWNAAPNTIDASTAAPAAPAASYAPYSAYVNLNTGQMLSQSQYPSSSYAYNPALNSSQNNLMRLAGVSDDGNDYV